MPCLATYERIDCALQERHRESSSRWLWQTAARVHHLLGQLFSVVRGTLRPDAGPRICLQLLRESPRTLLLQGLHVEHRKPSPAGQ
jgi:hypothetical protein